MIVGTTVFAGLLTLLCWYWLHFMDVGTHVSTQSAEIETQKCP